MQGLDWQFFLLPTWLLQVKLFLSPSILALYTYIHFHVVIGIETGSDSNQEELKPNSPRCEVTKVVEITKVVVEKLPDIIQAPKNEEKTDSNDDFDTNGGWKAFVTRAS